MYQNFIGIDMGKRDFCICPRGGKPQFYPNTPAGYQRLIRAYELKDALVVVETTGGYERALIHALQSKGIHVHRANTRRVKSFIRSWGTLGKTDELDAKALSEYGYRRQDELMLYEAPSAVEEELRQLVGRRNSLKAMSAQEKIRLQGPLQGHIEKSIKKTIRFLEGQAKEIQERAQELIQADERLMEKMKVLKSVDGIGELTAMGLLALMPELGKMNRRQAASLAGLAPHPNASGGYEGYRKVRGGRQEIRSMMHMAAMGASRSKSRLGSFYQHLLENGKKKMVAQTALARKIIVIANARLKEYEQSAEVAMGSC